MLFEGEEEMSGVPQKSHKDSTALENLIPCKDGQNSAGWLVFTGDL